MLFHQSLELVDRKIADRYEGHVGRHVPGLVEVSQRLRSHRLDGLHRADGFASLVGGSDHVGVVEDAADGAVAGLEAQPQLVADHAALGGHIGLGEGGRVRPLGQDPEGGVHRTGLEGRHIELVDGGVVGREGVRVRAELHAEAAQHLDDLGARVLLGAVEHHVLEEVGHAETRVGLVQRPGINREAQRQVVARRRVAAEVVGESVAEHTDPHCGIHRQRCSQIGGRQLDRVLLGSLLLSRLVGRHLFDGLRRIDRLVVGSPLLSRFGDRHLFDGLRRIDRFVGRHLFDGLRRLSRFGDRLVDRRGCRRALRGVLGVLACARRRDQRRAEHHDH